MRFWEIGKRNLKEIYRNPVLLGFLLGMPVVFMLVFCSAFGQGTVGPVRLSVVDEDRSQSSIAFVESLERIEAVELRGEVYSEEARAREDMEAGRISLYLLIPRGFQDAAAAGQPVDLGVVYEGTDPMAGLRVKPVLEAAGSQFLGMPAPVNVEMKGVESRIENEVVNFLAPGIIVFGLMILISVAAEVIAADREKGFLARMLTTPAKPWEFIMGYSLPFIPVLIVSTLIYLGVGMAMGLTIVGNLGHAFLIFFLTGLSAVGIGMIVGSLIKSESQAAICWVFIVPLAMISGAWWTVEMMPQGLQNFAGGLPFIHAMNASRSVINGASLSAVIGDLYWLIAWAIVLFSLGIIFFKKRMVS